MEPKTDGICRKLHDVGIFLIGVAAVVFTASYIWAQTHSPEREMQKAVLKSMTEGFKHSMDNSNETPTVLPPTNQK
jgi:hypothetical protein